MDKLTSMLKEHQIGEWCKRAAWVIAAIGIIEIVCAAYSMILQLQQANGDVGMPTVSLAFLVANLEFPLSTAAQATFFFFTLYAAGAFINKFVGKEEDEEDEDEEEDEMLAEDEEDGIVPGQFTGISPE